MRKLTYAALAYVFALLFIHYSGIDTNIFYVLIACILVSAAFIRFNKDVRMRILIVSSFFLLGVVRYELHAYNTIDVFEQYIGSECRITAELCEYPVEYDDSVKYTVKLYTDLLPKTKAVIYDYTTTDSDLIPGARFRVTVRLSSALFSSGEETDTYISKGIYVRGYVTDEVKVISEDFRLKYAPLYLAESIRGAIEKYMTPRTSAFLTALMTGDKNALYADAELNHTLTRAGLSHVVAVSGMHVSFVVAFAMLLLGHHIGWTVSILFILLFALMTGLTPSVLRAVFMQILFLLAPVLRREADGITSISFALLVILLINPFAISSVGLQLSFLAMTGIMLITPRALSWFDVKCPLVNSKLTAIYRFITASLSSSLGATIFTVPICAYYYGSIAVLSPLTNLLVLWIVPICFVGGFALFAVSLILPYFAPAIACVVEVGIAFIFTVSDIISELPFASLYLPPKLMLIWFFVVYAMIGVMFLVRKNNCCRPLIPISVALVSLLFLNNWNARYYERGLTIGAVDVGQGQCITVFDGDVTLMSDCGGNYKAGENAARWLYSHGREQVDLLVLSHFDEDHVNGILDLLLHIPVKEIIYCGNNITEDESHMFVKIKDHAENNGTKMTLLNRTNDLSLESMQLRIFVSDGQDSNDGLVVALQSGNYRMLLMGDADFDVEKQIMYDTTVNNIDCLVVGHHGSKTSTSEEFLERIDPKSAIISCGYNPYGHPSPEVLDRLTNKNVIIYRTDQLGSFEMKVR